jgi:CheY-like chemotaxis protein/two-component sensor histidine kinase
LTESQRKDIGRVRSAAKYLKELVDDVLDYQKIILGGVVLEPEEFEAAEFVEELCETMAPQAKERSDRLESNVDETVGRLCQDRARLRQVIVNLLSNACKFTDHGTITLTASGELDEAGQKWVRFEIADTGRGIKPEELETLFVRFKKLSARQGNQSGTGLGLVISKELVGLMGGTISCSSEFGKGSVFSVRIPATLREAEGVQPAAVQPLAPVIARQRPTVLIIDDDPAMCELIERFLGSKGYNVVSAGDGSQGVALARDRQPAVITLDVILPGGQTGWEVLGQLKSDSRTAQIPVVIITSLEDSRHGYALGAADYIVKAIEWDGLLRSIKRIAGISPPVSPVLVVEDDPHMREIFRRQLVDGGLEVVEAGDGVEALKRLREITPSVILLDLIMPNMDGFGFVAEFNCHPEWRAIPILIITAKNPTREDRERLTGTVRAILEKDGSTREELLATVASLIDRQTPMGQS